MMQDEVSETENIRKNLSIERMIVEGCDILLDVNQTFVRQGLLSRVLRLTSFSQAEIIHGDPKNISPILNDHIASHMHLLYP